uniref:Uncharacterized protein n=1 Tax=Rhizophora mucronata TaxID=61149 RepID=A0A2P2Q839_RHIMU
MSCYLHVTTGSLAQMNRAPKGIFCCTSCHIDLATSLSVPQSNHIGSCSF